ncbi:unnamed protein product [Colias eurytheme]|nr:unnamed protein product [Colias eurytheme]
MSENTSKEPPLQTMSGMPPNHNPWMYGLYNHYNSYQSGMYPHFYNQQYFNQMANNGGFHNETQFQPSKDSKSDFGQMQFSKPPPPLLGMSPLDTNRPYFNQSPIRFNLNSNRKSTPIPPTENPLLLNHNNNNNNNKKKRKKGNNRNTGDNDTSMVPPLPDHPPPLPPCPPPDDLPKPPPPPLDVPLPPPIATEDIPEPLGEPIDSISKEGTSEFISNSDSSNFLQSSSIQTSAGTWPESLERYIKRCYEKCKTGFDRDQIDICLKGRITAAANREEIWTRNWDEEPIPSVHSERDYLQQKHLVQQRIRKGGDVSYHIVGQGPGAHLKKGIVPHLLLVMKLKKKRFSKAKVNQKLRKDCHWIQRKMTSMQKKPKKVAYSAFQVEDVQGNAEKLQKRAERFANSHVPSIASSLQVNPNKLEPSPRKPILMDTEGDYELNNIHIVGTCLDIEKSFLRLTRAPEACEVRPVSVLRNSLRNVKDKWIERQDYRYACDQLKSIRQDLTVQGVRDSFTVEVYETHARIALEKGDHEEFNQCQTQLKMLYSELPESRTNAAEFTAYRILYYLFTKNTLDLTTIFKFLTKEDRENDCIKHALNTRCAWATGNLHKFFILYKTAPLMAGYLMDWFVERERKQYLKYIIKSYRQSVPVEFITKELAFESSTKAFEFLNQFPLSYTGCDQTQIDCKASLPAIANI